MEHQKLEHQELVSDFDFGPGDHKPALLQTRLYLLYLADHVYHLSDATAFREFLLKQAEAMRTEVARSPKSLPPAPQPRYHGADFCPDCGHVHADDSECGFPQGGGRICRCERTVRA